MATLSEHQRKFSRLFGAFIVWIFEQPGYEAKIEEVKRTQAAADANAAHGTGIVHSLHLLNCAGDLSLFVNGIFVTDLESYRPLGEKWKSMDPDCVWGGDFTTRPDADHFSLQWQGVK